MAIVFSDSNRTRRKFLAFASKLDNCRKCEFFKTVRREENFAFQDTRKIRQAYIIGNYAYYMGEGYKELLERKHRVPAKEGFARL